MVIANTDNLVVIIPISISFAITIGFYNNLTFVVNLTLVVNFIEHYFIILIKNFKVIIPFVVVVIIKNNFIVAFMLNKYHHLTDFSHTLVIVEIIHIGSFIIIMVAFYQRIIHIIS